MIYISGKITNEDKEIQAKNLARFFEVEKELGERCINPARHGDSPDRSYESYVIQDLILIFAHRPELYMMKGWEESRGARLEWELAHQLGLTITYEK